MKEVVIRVNGMMCEGCENRVKNALNDMEYINSVVASHVDGTVTLTIEENIDITSIEEKINDLGFEVVKEN